MHEKFAWPLAAALALAGCGNGAEPAGTKRAAPVRVAVVEQAPAVETLRAVGVLALHRRRLIRSRKLVA